MGFLRALIRNFFAAVRLQNEQIAKSLTIATDDLGEAVGCVKRTGG